MWLVSVMQFKADEWEVKMNMQELSNLSFAVLMDSYNISQEEQYVAFTTRKDSSTIQTVKGNFDILIMFRNI